MIAIDNSIPMMIPMTIPTIAPGVMVTWVVGGGVVVCRGVVGVGSVPDGWHW